jgi:hypothetical protein
LQHVPLDPHPQDSFGVLGFNLPGETKSSEDKQSFVVQAIRLEAVVASKNAEHAAQGSIIHIEGTMVYLDAAALELRPQLVVQPDSRLSVFSSSMYGVMLRFSHFGHDVGNRVRSGTRRNGTLW